MSSHEDDSSRPMNDTTMPPPPALSVGAASTASSVGKRSRNKQALLKGFGLNDWMRLLKSSKDLAQRGDQGLRRITRDEVRQHSTIHDGWMILHGKVYNIAPYLHYHPGGVDILKACLGKDGSSLFNKYHRWVNIDGLVGPLLLGYLDDSGSNNEDDDQRSYLPPQARPTGGFAVPAPRPPKAVPSMLPQDACEDEEDMDPLEG